ncbi:hypothetical protein [Paenibacillus lutimineralis]|uniref:ArpU family transcriptional regulator n=1 Tax=Paenibacillus lutimineralis TaxID=2707005 RepID=A0A3Q9IEL4_9BACL|nr:hypothetical protein [Paenibacillus lutimineralis]AZS17404.1 hypothetical protein EI981_25265 [Paenibacillus lutimineralis]
MEQIELFESVTDDERSAVKLILKHYPKMKAVVNALTMKNELTYKQMEKLNKFKPIVSEIETAFTLIIDPEVKTIFEHRYMKGQKYLSTIDLFWDKQRSERTIDRRIATGVNTIAEHLKLCGII